jgi:arylsulfatase
MEVYAAMIDRMDAGIARIVAELQRTGRLDNTLVFFLQDNGGCAELMGRQPAPNVLERPARPPLEAEPADLVESAFRRERTRDGYVVRQGQGVMPGPYDTYIGYGLGWANVSNTPFREYKHYVHEGGIGTPLIAHWPAKIKRKGELEAQPGHLVDLMATCIDVAGATYPTKVGDEMIKPMEGVSLAPAFEGRSLDRKNPIFWEHEGNRAIRKGKWKLVLKCTGPWELYDIEADRTEQHDAIDEQPELAKKMIAEWEAWAARSDVDEWEEEERPDWGSPIQRKNQTAEAAAVN